MEVIKKRSSILIGNYKAPKYREISNELLESWKDMSCNTSLKIYFLQTKFHP